jgi:murein DD-endopeptidase MepM/ murein hydrolase activator NlpD
MAGTAIFLRLNARNMGKFNKLILCFFVLTEIIFPMHLCAQNEDGPPYVIYESVNDSIDLRSNFYDTVDSLSQYFPAADLYESWDNEYMHYPKVDFSKKEDTTMLVLCDGVSSFFYMPKKGKVNSEYGWRRRRFHYGTDIDLEIGDSVRSAFDGVVRVARYHKGYGNVIVVRHFNGLETIYGHLSVARVLENQTVKAGDLIGFGGNTGRSTGPHLHFEARYLGTPFNPRKLIDFDKSTLISDTLLISKGLFNYKSVPKSSGSVSHSAGSKTVSTGGKTYHVVKSGETLSHIAQRYHTSVSLLCKLNGLSTKSILRIGQKIRVN